MNRPALSWHAPRVGVWTFALGREPASFERAAAAELEDLGFEALWVGEAPWTKEALVHSALLLEGTRRLVVATGGKSACLRQGPVLRPARSRGPVPA
jgi:alkanesulfonate monooxygenase SsuD/methylene tetrahydromethanopterin reductase-like flavin-dependent oxidoreductase (luciferase family)